MHLKQLVDKANEMNELKAAQQYIKSFQNSFTLMVKHMNYINEIKQWN